MRKFLLLVHLLVIQVTLFIPDVSANNSLGLSIPVRMPLSWLIPNGASGCKITFTLPDNKEIDFSIEKEDSKYTSLSVDLPSSTTNYTIKTKNDSLFFGSRCEYKAEFTVNELIVNAWEGEFPEKKKFACIKDALNFNGIVTLSHEAASSSKNIYPLPNGTEAYRVNSACSKVLAIELESNVSCDYPAPIGKTTCDEGYAADNDKNRKLNFQEAVRAEMNGRSVSVRLWENDDGRIRRLEREARAKSLQEQEETRRKWLETPEGKKYLAEEAARGRKEEQEREREEASKKVYGSYLCFQEVFLDKLTDRTQKGADEGGFLFKLNGTVGVMSINNAASYSAGPWYFSFIGKRSGDKRGTAYYTYQVNDRFFRKIHLEVKDGIVVWMAQEADKAMMSGTCRRKSN